MNTQTPRDDLMYRTEAIYRQNVPVKQMANDNPRFTPTFEELNVLISHKRSTSLDV